MKSRLNIILAEKRMTKKELAQLSGYSRPTISRWSTDEGVGQMSVRQLHELAAIIGCSPKDIFE